MYLESLHQDLTRFTLHLNIGGNPSAFNNAKTVIMIDFCLAISIRI